MPPSTTTSARRKLELSQLTPQAIQREAMGADVDVNKFVLFLASQVKTDIVDRIIDANITRSIDQASTLIVTVNDYDRSLLRSGLLSNKLDVELDGLWFRLAGVDKQGDELTLTFEDRAVAVLRTYSTWKIARRSKVTRAEFVLNLIREVKEFHIPVQIPELITPQPIQRFADDNVGIDGIINKTKGINIDPSPNRNPPNLITTSKVPTLFAKTAIADHDQLMNANIILAVGEEMLVKYPHKRKLMVCAIMTAITESVLRNEPDKAHGGKSDGDSAGLFQQRPSWGSYEDRMNPEAAARLFYRAAMKNDTLFPDVSYGALCQDVQNSAYPKEYANYRTDAERYVIAYGVVGGDQEGLAAQYNGMAPNIAPGKDFFFYRGSIYNRNNKKFRKPENSWSCIQRLADDVDWRAFFVSGTFYFISEDDLLKQKPAFILTEFTEGITDIEGNYDNNKKSATLRLTARVGRWLIPPGNIIVLQDMGPWNGRWIVSSFERSLFDLTATITLTKERPELPEPFGFNDQTLNLTWVPTGVPGEPAFTNTTTIPSAAGGFLPPFAKYIADRVDQGRDFITDPGGPIVAPGDGWVLDVLNNGPAGVGFGTSYPIVKFSDGPFAGQTMYIGHCLSALEKGATFKAGDTLAVTGKTGNESWNGNASKPGWCEIGFAPGGFPGVFGQFPPF